MVGICARVNLEAFTLVSETPTYRYQGVLTRNVRIR